MPSIRSLLAASATTAVATLVAVPAADGATRLIIEGRGFGHGVGMSQYGAYGFAKEGRDYKEILGHYYTDTKIGKLDSEPEVRVLLRTSSRATFTGARKVAGDRNLTPDKTYSLRRTRKGIALRSPTGRTMETYEGTVRIEAPRDGSIRLSGRAENGVTSGRYRGAFEFRKTGGELQAVNAVGLEDYVRGVISAESPAGWPQAALRAQAVAARTYAVTTRKDGNGFDHYADVRSQVYKGVTAEYDSTDEATRETAREVVTYKGDPVTTYFFSTSGGRTENVENVFGGEPQPHLKSVKDPFDDHSPKHTWTVRMRMSTAEDRLGDLVKGDFRRIEVLERGESPRVIRAKVVGSKGSTETSGATLRSRLRLNDTWASFKTVTSKATSARKAKASIASARSTGLFAQPTSGSPRISGRIAPAKPGSWLRVERRASGRWVLVAETVVGDEGRYSASVPRSGAYRVVHGGTAGPTVHVK